MILEVQRAINIWLDGFCYDILTTSWTYFNRLKLILDAAQTVDPDFKIVLMPDMMSEFKTYTERLVPTIISLADHPSVMSDDKNRLVLVPATLEIEIWGEKFSQDFWSGWITSFIIPLVEGKPIFRIIRNQKTELEVTGKWDIKFSDVKYYDLLYRWVQAVSEPLY